MDSGSRDALTKAPSSTDAGQALLLRNSGQAGPRNLSDPAAVKHRKCSSALQLTPFERCMRAL